MKTITTFSCSHIRALAFFCVILFCCMQTVNAQCDYYYWFFDKKVCLDKYDKMRYITVNNEEDTLIVRKQLEELGYTVSDFKKVSRNIIPYYPEPVKDKYRALIESNHPNDTVILNIDKISYVGPFVISFDIFILGITHLFDVQLHALADTTLLANMAKMHGITIIGSWKNIPLRFVLSCSKMSTGNALDMANLFNESQLFAWAEFDIEDYSMVNIPNISKEYGFRICPNPAIDYIKLEYDDTIDLQYSKIEILDISGKRVLFQNYENEMNVSMLNTGFYVLRIRKDGKILATEKFVKL